MEHDDRTCPKNLAGRWTPLWPSHAVQLCFQTSWDFMTGSVECFRPAWNCGGGRNCGTRTPSLSDESPLLAEDGGLLVWADFQFNGSPFKKIFFNDFILETNCGNLTVKWDAYDASVLLLNWSWTKHGEKLATELHHRLNLSWKPVVAVPVWMQSWAWWMEWSGLEE